MDEEILFKKNTILALIRKERKSHRRLVSRAFSLLHEKPVESGSMLSLSHQDCDFGRWYYGTGQMLSAYRLYRKLEEPHRKLHATFQEILHLASTETGKPSLLQRLRSRSPRRRLSEEQIARINELIVRLNAESAQFTRLLHELETKLRSNTDDEFYKLYRLRHAWGSKSARDNML